MTVSTPTDCEPQVVYQDDTCVVTRYASEDIAAIANAPVSISTNAVIKRINRRLNRNLHQLCVCRENAECYLRIGRYYLLDCRTNVLVETHVDLESLAIELGVLKQNEQID